MRDVRRKAAVATRQLGLPVSTPRGDSTPRLAELVTDTAFYIGIASFVSFGLGVFLREVIRLVGEW